MKANLEIVQEEEVIEEEAQPNSLTTNRKDNVTDMDLIRADSTL